MSILMTLVFAASFVEFANNLAHDWRSMSSQVRLVKCSWRACS